MSVAQVPEGDAAMLQLPWGKAHFSGLAFKHSRWRQPRTTSSCCRCCVTEEENTMMSSKKKSRDWHCWSLNILCINLWRVCGALHKPKGIQVPLEKAKSWSKAIFGSSCSATGTGYTHLPSPGLCTSKLPPRRQDFPWFEVREIHPFTFCC